MNRAASCQSTFRYVPPDLRSREPLICPLVRSTAANTNVRRIDSTLPAAASSLYADKENHQESHVVQVVVPHASTGKLSIPSPLAKNSLAPTSSKTLAKKRPSSTRPSLLSLSCDTPTLGWEDSQCEPERSSSLSDAAMRLAADALIGLKQPSLGTNQRDIECHDPILAPRASRIASSEPSLCPRVVPRPFPPRALNPVALTLWNKVRDDEMGSPPSVRPTDGRGGSGESWPVLRKESSPSASDVSAAVPSGAGREKVMSIAATPPSIDGTRVFRPQPKRLRICTY